MGLKAEESQTLFCRIHFSATETEPIPNLVVGDSERVAGKSKKRKGFRKPNTERPPNRTAESANFDSVISGMSCIGIHAESTSGVIADLWWSAVSGDFVSWGAKLEKPKIIFVHPSD